MIGKLTYEQITEIINTLNSANQSLKGILSQYNNNDAISMRASKLLKFCDDIEKYVDKLNDNIALNKDVDNVVNRLISKNN